MISELFLAGIGGIGIGVFSYFAISKYCFHSSNSEDSGMRNKFIANISCCRSEGHLRGVDSTDGVINPSAEMEISDIALVNAGNKEVKNEHNRN